MAACVKQTRDPHVRAEKPCGEKMLWRYVCRRLHVQHSYRTVLGGIHSLVRRFSLESRLSRPVRVRAWRLACVYG